MKILVISPHLDDAAFSLSLTINKWVADGQEIQIVNCFTRSEYAPLLHLLDLEPGERERHVTDLRRQEDVKWCRAIGTVKGRVDLNLKDAPLRLHCSSDDVCHSFPEGDGEATHEVRSYFKLSYFDAAVLPLAIGNHVDHLTARNAVVSLGFKGFPFAFYEDLPYAARPGAAEEIANLTARIALDLRPIFVERPRDVRSAIDQKKLLSLHYQSQISDSEADAVASFSARYCGRERLWANTAWRACSLAQEV